MRPSISKRGWGCGNSHHFPKDLSPVLFRHACPPGHPRASGDWSARFEAPDGFEAPVLGGLATGLWQLAEHRGGTQRDVRVARE